MTVVWSWVLACWAQTCRCTSSGYTTCAVRRRRYGRNDKNVAEAARVDNLGPTKRTSLNRRLDPCNVAIGFIGVLAGSSSGPLYNLATRLTKLPFKYRGKFLICTLLSRNFFCHYMWPLLLYLIDILWIIIACNLYNNENS